MVVHIKVAPIARVTVATVRQAALPVMQQAAAAYAQAGITEADHTNQRVLGRVPPRTITVDGKPGAPLNSVNPDGGHIIVEWDVFTDVLVWIGKTLQDRSPIQSGDYKNSHTLLADGVEVPLSSHIPDARQYIFVNTVPYARKIEIGKTKSGRAFVIQVPNRIYERTAKDARRRFGNIAKISFGYESIQGGGALSRWAQMPAARRHATRHRRHGDKAMAWLTRQPVIYVMLR